MRGILLASAATMLLTGCQTAQTDPAPVATESSTPAARPKLVTGNGERNYIETAGITRDGATFTVPTVKIEKNGWLVLHPFKDGKPVPTKYVGNTLVKAGTSKDVQISVSAAPAKGEMFVVMLHFDMNDDGVFDFNDGITVPDAPVFEDGKLIALRIAAP